MSKGLKINDKVLVISGKNKGKIEFEFYNEDDFERLLFEFKK